MIVKNEEKFIKQCIDNALPLVDEAVIVDTGSTDNTISIIKEYKNKIKLIKIKWENDFSKVRNVYLEKATGDWILVLDADEKIVSSRENLIKCLSSTKAEAFNLRMENLMEDDEKLNSWVYSRLFRNNGYRYYRAVHEQLNINRDKIENLEDELCKIIHYGYLKENIKLKNKIARNLNILLDEYKKNPEDSFICYHLGTTYAAKGEYGKALEFFTKSYSFGLKYGFGSYYFELIKKMGEVILVLCDYKLCIAFLLQLLKEEKNKGFTDLYFILGKAYYKSKAYKEAVEAFRICLSIGETNKFPSVLGRGSYKTLILLGELYSELKEKKLEYEAYSKAYLYKDNLTSEEIKKIKNIVSTINLK